MTAKHRILTPSAVYAAKERLAEKLEDAATEATAAGLSNSDIASVMRKSSVYFATTETLVITEPPKDVSEAA